MTTRRRPAWPKRKRIVIWILILIVFCLAIPGLLSFAVLRLPRQVVLPNQGGARALLRTAGYAPVIVTASDGVQLRGYSIHRPEARGTVVLVHGWGPNLATLDADAEYFLSRGFDVAGLDLRGHGDSGGTHSMLGFSEVGDLRSLFSHLRAEGRLPRPVVLSGISLGATIALLAAAEEPEVVGVIADSPFNRLEEAVDHYAARSLPIMPKYPMRWLTLRLVELQVGRRLSSLSVESVLPKLAPRPILLMHCEGDSLVLCRNSDQIAAAYPEHTEYWRIPGGDHLSARWQDPDEWERRVDAFLERLAPALRAP